MAKVRIISYPKSNENVKAKSTIQPVDRDKASLIAEKGETVISSDHSGLPMFFKIAGKSHSAGGTPLDLPENSFIFSKNTKLKIKDDAVLEMFNKSKSATPADISKQYDLNYFRKILFDPDTDKLQKSTAELMISNYNQKLGKLSLIQESMKGFPQGIPFVATPYLYSTGFDPSRIVSPEGDTPTPGSAEFRWGGEQTVSRGAIPQMYTALYRMGGQSLSEYDNGGPNFAKRNYSTGNKGLDSELDALYKSGQWTRENIAKIKDKADALGIYSRHPEGKGNAFTDMFEKHQQYKDINNHFLDEINSEKGKDHISKVYANYYRDFVETGKRYSEVANNSVNYTPDQIRTIKESFSDAYNKYNDVSNMYKKTYGDDAFAIIKNSADKAYMKAFAAPTTSKVIKNTTETKSEPAPSTLVEKQLESLKQKTLEKSSEPTTNAAPKSEKKPKSSTSAANNSKSVKHYETIFNF